METLKELLEAAERGDIRGMVFVVKLGPEDNRAGLAGTYLRRPSEALQATFKLERMLTSTYPSIERV